MSNKRKAKVFISCGQGTNREISIVKNVMKILEKNKFRVYVAREDQSLVPILTIIDELRTSDYFLFIDFYRPKTSNNNFKIHMPISLFSHQELALAYELGFKENVILIQEKKLQNNEGSPKIGGFLRYALTNPISFKDNKDLLKKIEGLIKKRWDVNYSRNLVPNDRRDEWPLSQPIMYGDHTGQSLIKVWRIGVENRRSDVAAIKTICILDYVEFNGRKDEPDQSNLKWAGQMGYEKTILPNDIGVLDIFSIHSKKQGIFLQSAKDTPRQPIIVNNGEYTLHFKLYSQNFPLVKFIVKLILQYDQKEESWPQIVKNVQFFTD